MPGPEQSISSHGIDLIFPAYSHFPHIYIHGPIQVDIMDVDDLVMQGARAEHQQPWHWPNSSWMQWNLYNETREVLQKSYELHHLPDMVFIKSCLFYLSRKTTCFERPLNLAVALYTFHCIHISSCTHKWNRTGWYHGCWWPGDARGRAGHQ